MQIEEHYDCIICKMFFEVLEALRMNGLQVNFDYLTKRAETLVHFRILSFIYLSELLRSVQLNLVTLRKKLK